MRRKQPSTTDERDLERASRNEKREEELLDAGLALIMSEKASRSFMWWLLGETGLFKTSFNTNALVMAHNEGRRSVGTMLIDRITEADAQSYLTMQNEAILKEQENE